MTNSSSLGPHWCTIAYWELRQRVGRLFLVHDNYMNVFQNLPHGDGLALDALQQHCDLEPVLRTREKIGFGIILSREGTDIWIYNNSTFPVFVNSSLFDLPNPRLTTVIKVLPGRSVKVFDCKSLENAGGDIQREFLDGPYDPRSLRISFAKGWGPNYHRQFVTSCPCWLEVLLNIDR